MPIITTVTLAHGAMRMARQRVIVKHLAAIEDFGSMTVLLSDKTGTLTSSETSPASSIDPFGGASERPHPLAYLNASFPGGVGRTGITRACRCLLQRSTGGTPFHQRFGSGISYRLVHRVACRPDARIVRHMHPGQSVAKSAKQGIDRQCAPGCCDRCHSSREPAGDRSGFVLLPPVFFIFLIVATVTYLLLVEMAKRRFMRSGDDASPA